MTKEIGKKIVLRLKHMGFHIERANRGPYTINNKKLKSKCTLTYFTYSAKNVKNKSDLKVDSGVHYERWN